MQNTPFCKVLIIRGIGYRAFTIENDLTGQSNADYTYQKYLVVRAGHTKDWWFCLPNGVQAKTLKKERKLVLYGLNKRDIGDTAATIMAYRQPSIYTGRGVRLKGVRVLRKVGKKDKQK